MTTWKVLTLAALFAAAVAFTAAIASNYLQDYQRHN